MCTSITSGSEYHEPHFKMGVVINHRVGSWGRNNVGRLEECKAFGGLNPTRSEAGDQKKIALVRLLAALCVFRLMMHIEARRLVSHW